MGGKSTSSTSSVQIPPEVLARYNAVNAQAETAAATPFQNYGGQFVAGLTPEQQQATSQTASASTAAQPYYNQAAGMTLGAAQNVGPLTPDQIAQYQNPYTQAVAAPTIQALQQQQGQDLSKQQAQAIQSGAYGGDRSGIARATLQGQQGLATAQAIAPIFAQSYNTALQTAAGQQGVVASDLARQMQSAQQLAGLGTGAQQAQLTGAQALMAAGTVGQQTNQADLTAQYQQFLQARGYPFQTAQFLANIAMGTGALSGSTTSTTQPAPFFSDARLKHDAKKIGETNDGLPIYSFKYNGDDRTQIGLMAQDVEKKKPEAVGLAPASDGNMYKTVDYDKATRAKKYAGGGLVGMDYDPSSMGGAVGPMSMGEAFARGGYAVGGVTNPIDESAILAANYQTAAMPFAEHGLHGTARGSTPGQAGGVVPAASLPVARLTPAQPVGANSAGQVGAGAQALNALNMGKQLEGGYQTGKTMLLGSAPTQSDPEGARGLLGGQGSLSGQNFFQSLVGGDNAAARGGLIVPRDHYEGGGGIDDQSGQGNGSEDEAGDVTPGLAGGIPLAAGKKAAQLATAKPSGPGQTGAGQLNSALGLANTAMTFGKDVGSLFGGSEASSIIPEMIELVQRGGRIGRKAGGLIPRDGYATDGTVEDTVNNAPGLLVSPDALSQDLSPPPTVDPGLVATTAPREAAAAPATSAIALPEDRSQRDFSPAALRQYTAARAQELGIDPKIPLAVWHGESSFNPKAVGDEKSSFNVPQLHYGNVSDKYPHAGLGNDFTNKTGLDARDPTTAYETIDYGLQHAAKNGWGDWSVAKQLGFAGNGGSSAPSKGFDLSSMLPSMGSSGPGMYNGRPSAQASLGDVASEFLPKSVPTSANFWVPALSGLGAMLSSPSHTLAGAIGSGLVGGVGGYQTQQKQEMEMAKNIFDVVKNRFTPTVGPDGNLVMRDNMSGSLVQPGQVQAAAFDMFTRAGIDPSKYGFGRVQSADSGAGAVGVAKQVLRQQTATDGTPAAGTPAAAQPSGATRTDATKPQAQAAAPVPKPIDQMFPGDFRADVLSSPQKYGFEPGSDSDPSVMLKKAQSLRAVSQTAAYNGFAQESAKLRTDAKDLNDTAEARIKDAYQGQYELAQQARKDTQSHANTEIEAIGKRQANYTDVRDRAIRLSEAFSRAQLGPGADWKGYVTGLVKSFGITPPPSAMNAEDAIAYANKEALTNVINDAASSNLLRAPKAITGLFQQINATGSMDPNAAYRLLGDTIGQMDYVNTRDADYAENHRGTEPTLHLLNYEKTHGPEDYQKARAKAYSDIAVPKDPNAGATVREMFKELGPYGYKPRIPEQPQAKGTATAAPATAPTANAPAAPAGPRLPTVKNDDDYNALQPGQYVAPDGTIRTKAGRNP